MWIFLTLSSVMMAERKADTRVEKTQCCDNAVFFFLSTNF